MTDPDRRQYLRCCLAGSVLLAGCQGIDPPTGSSERIDDWQYNPSDDDRPMAVSLDDADDESIGLAAGGAADVGTFRRNVAEGYLPIPESMAYEGLFHDYYFDTGGDGACESLFCPTYTPAVSADPLSGETDQFLSVGLDSGLAADDFERPPLNLVIVLDISGSMRASFDRYYYDQFGIERRADGDTSTPKMEVAKEVLIDLTHHLDPADRLGIVLFDHDSYVAKPLRRVETTDMDAIRGHIREDVEARGGTNIAAAMADAEALLDAVVDDDQDDEDYEHRSILLTDAQTNIGETDADELRTSLEARADRGFHTSVVGIGVDFNADLISQITGVRGANYYSVYSTDEFERRMVDEFEFMVTPLVYDLTLEVAADGYEIARVYGSPAADEATGEVLTVNTLFPSPSKDGEAKGGVVLVQVERTDDEPDDADIELIADWKRRDGNEESVTENVQVPTDDDHWGSDAVRKAVLLARYADLMRTWMIDEREPLDVDEGDGIESPAFRTGQWELQSEPLVVSGRNADRIDAFATHFESEMAAIGDNELGRELELMDEILAAAGEPASPD